MERPELNHETDFQSTREWIDKMRGTDIAQAGEVSNGAFIFNELLELELAIRPTLGKVSGGDKRLDDVTDADLENLHKHVKTFLTRIEELFPSEVFKN